MTPLFSKSASLKPSLDSLKKDTYSILKRKLSGHKVFKSSITKQGGQEKEITTILQDDSIQN